MIGERVLQIKLYGVKGNVWVEKMMKQVKGGEVGLMIVENIMVLFMELLIDYLEMELIIIKMMEKVEERIGIDIIWFGVMMEMKMKKQLMNKKLGLQILYMR